MSKVRIEKIECPHCHAEGEFTLWESVNVDIDPELKEKIFNEELFMYHCPNCGETTGIPCGTIYHDMSHNFMIVFDFFKPDDFDYKPMEMPEGLENKESYTFRSVFGINRLKEKIMILERGLNDVAIERQKYMISYAILPEIAEKGYELYFSRIEGPDEEFEHGKIFFVYDDKEKKQMTTVRFAMDNYYEHVLACEIDPRMKVKECVCIDNEWFANIMKEE